MSCLDRCPHFNSKVSLERERYTQYKFHAYNNKSEYTYYMYICLLTCDNITVFRQLSLLFLTHIHALSLTIHTTFHHYSHGPISPSPGSAGETGGPEADGAWIHIQCWLCRRLLQLWPHRGRGWHTWLLVSRVFCCILLWLAFSLVLFVVLLCPAGFLSYCTYIHTYIQCICTQCCAMIHVGSF